MRTSHYVLFCRVVDNFGDIGVCWRLAKNWQRDYGVNVSIFVDALTIFQQLVPAIKDVDRQVHDNINILRWSDNTIHAWLIDAQHYPPTAIVEAFACELPLAVIQWMRTCVEKALPQPRWINLDYLSAESWVKKCHTLPSPQGILTKHFFFPGFEAGTGGLIREKTPYNRFERFSLAARWEKLSQWTQSPIKPKHPQTVAISFFVYPNPRLTALLHLWENHTQPVFLFVPLALSEPSKQALSHFFGAALHLGKTLQKGALSLHVLPMLSQENYDMLLAQMDWNFVRGEDSFVRAQWACQPFVWHCYPQDAQTHVIKIQAFLERYCKTLENADIFQLFWYWWNGAVADSAINLPVLWQSLIDAQGALCVHAKNWAKQQMAYGNLGANLLAFIEKNDKNR